MKLRKTGSETMVNSHVDIDTGEVFDVDVLVKEHHIIVDDAPAFAMMYASMLGLLDELDYTCIKVLAWCAINCQYNENIVVLNKYNCSLIEEQYALKYQSIKNSISTLKKRNILISIGQATYRINPRYYWKGSSKNRLAKMKYILTVECNNC